MWLINQKRCFVVQFVLTGKFDDVVCVDGYRILVCCNKEPYAVTLNENPLHMCVGYNSKKVSVFAIVMVTESKKKTRLKTVLDFE